MAPDLYSRVSPLVVAPVVDGCVAAGPRPRVLLTFSGTSPTSFHSGPISPAVSALNVATGLMKYVARNCSAAPLLAGVGPLLNITTAITTTTARITPDAMIAI